MHLNDSRPFILMVGSRLTIPGGIKFEYAENGDVIIPLTVVEISNDVYHFIPKFSGKSVDVSLVLPSRAEVSGADIVVESVDLSQKTALARWA